MKTTKATRQYKSFAWPRTIVEVTEETVDIVSFDNFGGNNYSGAWAESDDSSLVMLRDGTQAISPVVLDGSVLGPLPGEVLRTMPKDGRPFAMSVIELDARYPLAAVPKRLVRVVAYKKSEYIYKLRNGQLWKYKRLSDSQAQQEPANG